MLQTINCKFIPPDVKLHDTTNTLTSVLNKIVKLNKIVIFVVRYINYFFS